MAVIGMNMTNKHLKNKRLNRRKQNEIFGQNYRINSQDNQWPEKDHRRGEHRTIWLSWLAAACSTNAGSETNDRLRSRGIRRWLVLGKGNSPITGKRIERCRSAKSTDFTR